MTKLDELAKMAREVIEERENTGQLQGEQQETADIVENRIEAAKLVISKLQAAKKRTSASGQYEMSSEELNSILTALTEAYVGSAGGGGQRAGAMQTKESLERSKKVFAFPRTRKFSERVNHHCVGLMGHHTVESSCQGDR